MSKPATATKPIRPVIKTPKVELDLQPLTAPEASDHASQPDLEQLIHHEDDGTFEGLFN